MTYTPDVNELITQINANLPDNTQQLITAKKVRDTLSAIAYNYDLYMLKGELDELVTKAELDAAGYITQETVSQASYVTQDALSSMGYITTIPEEYITQEALSAMGYLTEHQDLSSYATKAYVADYVAEHAPTPDLSAYVTHDYLNAAGYISSIPAEYITESELASMSYATQSYVMQKISEIPSVDLSAYVTKTDLDAAGYITQETVSQASYVTQDALSSMGYITTIPAEYITQEELSAMGYLTEHQDLSAYVTKSELDNAGYITQETVSQASYVTQDALSSMGYITTIPTEYITESELASMSYATQTYVADYVAAYAPTPDLSAYVTHDYLDAAGYITSIPAEYITDSELSAAGYATQSYVMQKISEIPGVDMSAYVTHDYLNAAAYTTVIELTTQEYDALSYDAKHNGAIYVLTDATDVTYYVTEDDLAYYATQTYVADYVAEHAPTPDLSAYVSKTELNSMSYATQTYVADYVAEHGEGGGASVYSVTYAQYQELINTGTYDPTTLYLITDGSPVDTSYFATQAYVVEYVATYAPTPDLSAYVSKAELDAAGYISSIPSEYITESELSSMSYATQTYVVDYVAEHGGGGGASVYSVTYAQYQELINTGTYDPHTLYLITDGTPVDTSTFATQAYVVDYVAAYAPTPDLSAYVSKTELNSMSYATQTYVADYVAAYAPTPDLSAYVTKTELDAASYTNTYECTQAQYDYMVDHGLTYDNTLYVITDAIIADLAYYATQTYVADYVAAYAPTPDLSAYVTKTELSAASYLTYANFIYDSATSTLTISI